MVQRWQWTLAIVMLGSWAGCSGSSKQSGVSTAGSAGAGNTSGNAGVGNVSGNASVTGGTTSEGGEAGSQGDGGSSAGKGGVAGASAGVGGTGGVGGMGGAGGIGGIGGMGATAGGGGEPGPPPPAPPTWSCLPSLYGDGVCHCGCSVVDVDCFDRTAGACESCPSTSCTPGACDGVKHTDNAVCEGAPSRWICEAAHYDDGECDCGCGYWDSDCPANEIGACERCDSPGSCSLYECPTTIDPVNIAYCTAAVPPEEWSCGGAAYADMAYCDCGCGARDLDCSTTDIAECNRCSLCWSEDCSASVDPEDPTHCIPPPDGWLCDAEHYGDRVCNCGCGVRDIDCDVSYYCFDCPPEGCTMGDCTRLDPMDNSQCIDP